MAGPRKLCPTELVFNVNYLGGDMPTFALNFSRPGAQVVAQYYTFVRLGREGYRGRAAGRARRGDAPLRRDRAMRPDSAASPAATSCRCSPSRRADDVTAFDVFDVSRRLRERGWLVPAYSFPENREDLAVLRVVVRNGYVDLLEMLIDDIDRLLPELRKQSGPLDGSQKQTFHH